MPFVQLLVHPEMLSRDTLLSVRDVSRSSVAAVLTQFDPHHVVLNHMVDVTVSFVGPLDLVEPPVYVTVLARDEPERSRHRDAIVARIEAAVVAAGAPTGSMVELVLTNRSSAYSYDTEG